MQAALVFLHLELFDHLMACLNGKVFHGNHLRRVYPECLEVGMGYIVVSSVHDWLVA